MHNPDHTILYTVVGVYFGLMLALGYIFRGFNKDISDYFRSGCRGTWWLVGSSLFVSGLSAWSFTGASSMAYQWGWAILWNYWTGILGMIIVALFLAHRLRRIRAITGPETIGLRFDELTRQVFSYKGSLSGMLFSGVHLYGLAVFTSAVFGFHVQVVIVVIGIVVVLYSTAGGKFAVMATDFLQTLFMVPMTILLGIIALSAIGGVDGLFGAIRDQGLQNDFALVKPAGLVGGEIFTLPWIIATFITLGVMNQLNFATASRYFACKTEREARLAPTLACVLTIVGTFFWFLPPIVSRLLYSDQVESLMMKNPSEAAYAVAAFNLLPDGLIALILVAIFSATMSTMDSGVNGNAAVVVRDIYPGLCRLFKRKPMGEKGQLILGQILSLFFGACVITTSLFYSNLRGMDLFQIMMNILALFGMPLSVPLLWGIVVKRVPGWSALFAGSCAMAVSGFSFLVEGIFGEPWLYHEKVFYIFGTGTVMFFATIPFYKYSSEEYKARVEEFFARMRRPIDFETEVGGANDDKQLLILGSFAVILCFFLQFLHFTPMDPGGRLTLAILSSVVFILGLIMLYLERRMRRR